MLILDRILSGQGRERQGEKGEDTGATALTLESLATRLKPPGIILITIPVLLSARGTEARTSVPPSAANVLGEKSLTVLTPALPCVNTADCH